MTVAAKKFILNQRLQILLKDLGIPVQDLLRRARLPLDLYSQKTPSLTPDEYFRLWDGVAYFLRDVPAFPLRVGQAVPVEALRPSTLACFCSADLNAALVRFSQYKPLVGPLTLDVEIGDDVTSVTLGGLPVGRLPPPSFVAAELVFLVHMARLASRERIVPRAVRLAVDLPERDAYEEFFGVPLTAADANGLVFAAEDARRPFLTAHDDMWSALDPKLRPRMTSLGLDPAFRDRVRACLNEILASGRCSMADVAKRLGVSTRTLHRRLQEEGTTFQKELNGLREELARHHLANTHYTSAEISFMLGYSDPSSFFRAFHEWTGLTPEAARSELRLH